MSAIRGESLTISAVGQRLANGQMIPLMTGVIASIAKADFDEILGPIRGATITEVMAKVTEIISGTAPLAKAFTAFVGAIQAGADKLAAAGKSITAITDTKSLASAMQTFARAGVIAITPFTQGEVTMSASLRGQHVVTKVVEVTGGGERTAKEEKKVTTNVFRSPEAKAGVAPGAQAAKAAAPKAEAGAKAAAAKTEKAEAVAKAAAAGKAAPKAEAAGQANKTQVQKANALINELAGAKTPQAKAAIISKLSGMIRAADAQTGAAILSKVLSVDSKAAVQLMKAIGPAKVTSIAGADPKMATAMIGAITSAVREIGRAHV
jgi:hypothetical protein